MTDTAPERSLRHRLILGFAFVIVLFSSVTVIGLARLGEVSARLNRVVTENNAKVELAYVMRDALRERAVIMHSVLLLSDPFEQDAEFLRFNEYGGAFSTARNRLEALPLSDAEKEILARMRGLTLKAQPLVVQAVDLAMSGARDAARALIVNDIIPAQKTIAQEINGLLEWQKAETEQAVRDTFAAYEQTRTLMLGLGGTAAGLGLLVSFVVVRHTNRQAQRLQHQAMYDGLTNLPNRVLFADRLQQAILIGRREKKPFGLIALDLDRFKEINDSLGHHTGDRVLQEVAQRLHACLRESDTVARMGGDEFTILLFTVTGVDGAVAVADKILTAFDPPLAIGGQSLDIGASLGIATFPQHGEEAETLLRAADAAMYAAKQAHGGYRVYNVDMDAMAESHVTLQGDLRHAIAGDELVLHYQPKIDCATNRVTGVEALVRWQHPKLGLLAPDKFIPLAERTGLIKGLTQKVLRAALRQAEEWQRAGLDLSLSVNVSAINIQDAEFPDQVAAVLKEFAVPPARIELEMTETAVMTEPVRAVECIKKLSALGVQISIDDFGTGYSSMTHLKELLVAKIKIDRSFVTDMDASHNDAVIVRSTIELGHQLGLKVIAEGVESEVVWDRLRALGCDSAQGYYMSHPLPPKELLDWLRQSKWRRADPSA